MFIATCVLDFRVLVIHNIADVGYNVVCICLFNAE